MRALVCSSFDGPAALAMGELPDPQPGPRDVLVEVHAASVTFMDCLMVSGQYQLRPPLPFAPGTEAAGVVVRYKAPAQVTSELKEEWDIVMKLAPELGLKQN